MALEMRQIRRVIGARAWIRSRPPRTTDLLPHNASVEIIAISPHHVFVRSDEGKMCRFATTMVDPGWEFRGRSGHWYPENHLKALEALTAYLGKPIEVVDDAERERENGRRETINDILARQRNMISA